MQEVQIVQVRPWYHKPAPWISAGIVICLTVLAMPHVQRVYHRWSEVRKVKRATEAFARNDLKEAALNARGALATNDKNIEALRVMAKITQSVGSPEAMKFRQKLDAIKPGDVENLLGVAEYNLKVGNTSAAKQALDSVAPPDREIANYYSIAAGVALAQKDATSAESYAAKAVSMAPNDEGYQLRLAALRLSSRVPEMRAAALERLQKLSKSPATRARALRTLLLDAQSEGNVDGALELATELAEAPEATFADKLVQLTTMQGLRRADTQMSTGKRSVSQAELDAALDRLQKESIASAENLYQILAWMNEHHMALLAQDWIATLPKESIAKSSIAATVADTYRRCSSWQRLREAVENGNWDRLEPLRFAYLSRALESLGDAAGAATAWTNAIDATKGQQAMLEVLARETAKWNWKRQNEEVLWKLTTTDPCPRWVVDSLWTSSLQRKDSLMLYKLSKLILQTEPKSTTARDHYISLALITGQEGNTPHSLAEAHFKAHPENVAVASTYGLSLFLQGRAEEAVRVMAQFPPEQMQMPALAFYQGIFLAAAGRPEEGERFFRIGEQAPQFDELIEIRNFLRTVFEADAAQRGGTPAESAKTWQAALQASQSQARWLEILGRIALKWQNVERAGEAAQRLADIGQCPGWAVEPLWLAALRTGDPAKIQKASKLILDANPKSLGARSNFTTAALLGGREGDGPDRLAESLNRENPSQVEAVIPYSYVLYRQGKSVEALTLFQGLDAKSAAQPRAALYRSLLLAAASRVDEAVQVLPATVDPSFFPEEKAICETLRNAFKSRAADLSGDKDAGDASWTQAVNLAQGRPDLLETLGRMAQKWEAPQRVDEALWKLADAPAVPAWVVEALAISAEKRRDASQLYRVVRLQRRANPQDVTIRNRFVWLALLTGQNAEYPDRLARELFEENPKNVEVAVTYALSLHQQKKTEKALEILDGMPLEQLRGKRAALYYGIFLTAAGQDVKAREFLRVGSESPMMSEEQNLLNQAEKKRASAAR